MAQVELIMPKMGESIVEARILRWLKNEGDSITIEELVLEIATDKVDSEVPSPVAGTLVKKLYAEDQVIPVGQPIALIETEIIAAVETNQNAPVPVREERQATSQQVQTQTQTEVLTATLTDTLVKPTNGTGRFYSPLVLNMAREEGISMAELEGIAGSGQEGRVTKKDMLSYISNRQTAPTVEPVKQTEQQVLPPAATEVPRTTAAPVQGPKINVGEGDEIVEMDRMRRLIADHMVMSKQVSPHVTSFIEVDVTNLVNWRNRIKDNFKKREGENITFTPVFVEIVVRAIKDFPMINSSVDGTKMILRKNINIGMAAATPSGNLIVPVIKNADHKNLIGLAKEVNDLANRARIGKLKPDEIQGGTFTISNVGTFGSIMGTPIINQPQVAILATGAIRKKPAVIETEYGDVIAIRHQMILSLSYDHRIVDGALGSMFLKRIADLLEAFDVQREI